MSDNKQFDQDDLALYAMQLLSNDERAYMNNLIELSPELRRELAETQGDLAIYATTAETHSPPALARERLLTQIGRERKVRSIDRTQDAQTQDVSTQDIAGRSAAAYGAGPGTAGAEDGRHNFGQSSRTSKDDLPRTTSSFGRIVPWLGWAVAAGLAVTTGNLYHASEVTREENHATREAMARDHAEFARLTLDAAAARQLMDTLKDPTATRVTLTRSKDAPQPQGKVTYVANKGALLFVASNFEPLDTPMPGVTPASFSPSFRPVSRLKPLESPSKMRAAHRHRPCPSFCPGLPPELDHRAGGSQGICPDTWPRYLVQVYPTEEASLWDASQRRQNSGITEQSYVPGHPHPANRYTSAPYRCRFLAPS